MSVEADVKEIRANMEHVKVKVDDMHKVLHGNSDPSKGLVMIVHDNQRHVQTVQRVVWVFMTAAIGGLAASLFALFKVLIQLQHIVAVAAP